MAKKYYISDPNVVGNVVCQARKMIVLDDSTKQSDLKALFNSGYHGIKEAEKSAEGEQPTADSAEA